MYNAEQQIIFTDCSDICLWQAADKCLKTEPELKSTQSQSQKYFSLNHVKCNKLHYNKMTPPPHTMTQLLNPETQQTRAVILTTENNDLHFAGRL